MGWTTHVQARSPARQHAIQGSSGAPCSKTGPSCRESRMPGTRHPLAHQHRQGHAGSETEAKPLNPGNCAAGRQHNTGEAQALNGVARVLPHNPKHAVGENMHQPAPRSPPQSAIRETNAAEQCAVPRPQPGPATIRTESSHRCCQSRACPRPLSRACPQTWGGSPCGRRSRQTGPTAAKSGTYPKKNGSNVAAGRFTCRVQDNGAVLGTADHLQSSRPCREPQGHPKGPPLSGQDTFCPFFMMVRERSSSSS
jgi:hypothetical protein